ncbi:hypothetical protein ES703_106641 [subsurface metagenome]
MRVLLMDLDIIKQRRPFPNLALMKLSAYHRARGDQVYLNFPLDRPDITYASCVFTWNAKRREGLTPDVIIGGSGVDLKAELPPEVEHIMPDYSLYPSVNFSMGFTSRGCIRMCPWCIVPVKEGHIEPWASIYEFWDRRHSKIVLLDNNLLASPNWKETLLTVKKEGVEVDFNQGLDIRLVTYETALLLRHLKTRQLRFAFDNIAYEKAVRTGIELLLERGINSRKLSFYVLVGFNGDETAVERIKLLHSYKVDVYPMVYKGPDGKEPRRRILKGIEDIPLLHGPRRNIDKFLRLVGRLPE